MIEKIIIEEDQAIIPGVLGILGIVPTEKIAEKTHIMTDIPNIILGVRIRMIILDLITAPIIKIPIVGILLTVSIKDGIIEIIKAKWQ